MSKLLEAISVVFWLLAVVNFKVEILVGGSGILLGGAILAALLALLYEAMERKP